MLALAFAALAKHSTYLEIPDQQTFRVAIEKIHGFAQKELFVNAICRIANEMDILDTIPEKIMYQNRNRQSRVCILVDQVREFGGVIGQGEVVKDFENALIKDVTSELRRMQALVCWLVSSKKAKAKMQRVKEYMKTKGMEDRLCEEKETAVCGCAVRVKMAIEQMDARFGGFSLFSEPDAKRRIEAFSDARWPQHEAVCKLVRYCKAIGSILSRLFVCTSAKDTEAIQAAIRSLPTFSIQY